jgi:hypothetical protein
LRGAKHVKEAGKWPIQRAICTRSRVIRRFELLEEYPDHARRVTIDRPSHTRVTADPQRIRLNISLIRDKMPTIAD